MTIIRYNSYHIIYISNLLRCSRKCMQKSELIWKKIQFTIPYTNKNSFYKKRRNIWNKVTVYFDAFKSWYQFVLEGRLNTFGNTGILELLLQIEFGIIMIKHDLWIIMIAEFWNDHATITMNRFIHHKFFSAFFRSRKLLLKLWWSD